MTLIVLLGRAQKCQVIVRVCPVKTHKDATQPRQTATKFLALTNVRPLLLRINFAVRVCLSVSGRLRQKDALETTTKAG